MNKFFDPFLNLKMLNNEFWLTETEQIKVIEALLFYNLIKMSNNYDLPLKKGGYTDIYINIRDARNHPDAIAFLAQTFASAIFRLGADRFMEVPHSISCLAGSISERLQIPYVTIREEEKKGRATTGKIIGSIYDHDRVAIIDDVITDGASKREAYRQCLFHNAIPTLVVLVDRQDGWKQLFNNSCINMPVWAGMSLHQLRFHLINYFGVMERCDLSIENKNPIILALDGKDLDELLPLLSKIRTTGCMLKVNDLLHNSNQVDIVSQIGTYGRVMVDFKGHDIPNTVYNTCKRYAAMKNPPHFVTIHASGGHDMIAAAVKAFEGTSTKVLAVTVLTSLNNENCETIYGRNTFDQVITLAKIGEDAGAHGFVCSPQEVFQLRKIYSEKILVTPGIRSPEVGTDDQARWDSPKNAIHNGSNHLVIGRQILNSSDPQKEIEKILSEINE